jgi:hypothetical protein
MLHYERFAASPFEWESICRVFPTSTVFQSSAWLAFLAETQKGEPITALLKDGNKTVGCYAGVKVRRFGVPILGSPFAGWNTEYMGLNLLDGVSRHDAIFALKDFAFRSLKCVHFELMDRRLTREDLSALEMGFTTLDGFEIDLSMSEDQLFLRMTSACRRCIRKAEKYVTVEEAHDPAFADDYYAQLIDVFAKQRLVPTYGIERVHHLIRHMKPTGALSLLRARDPQGTCIATFISLGANGTMYMWGAASWREHQILRPNELLIWTAMKYWKARGMHTFDMGGSGEYKRKYGGREISVPWIQVSRYPMLGVLRQIAKKGFRLRQRVAGRWAEWSSPGQVSDPVPALDQQSNRQAA